MGFFEFADKVPDFIGLITIGGAIRGTAVGSAAAQRDLVEFVDAHGIKPIIARTFRFAETRAAYEALDDSNSFGKIVITISD